MTTPQDCELKLKRAIEIAKDILLCNEWRDPWEDDYAGGANVRKKIKEIAALGEVTND